MKNEDVPIVNVQSVAQIGEAGSCGVLGRPQHAPKAGGEKEVIRMYEFMEDWHIRRGEWGAGNEILEIPVGNYCLDNHAREE